MTWEFHHGSHRPWKVLEFDYCLEKCLIFQSALKICNFPWKVLENNFFMGLKNNGPTNLIYLCVYTCCILNFDKLRGFGNFVIKSPVTTDPVIHVFNSEYCNGVYGKLSHQRKTCLRYTRYDLIVLEKCNFVLDKSLKSPGISFWKKCGNLVSCFF